MQNGGMMSSWKFSYWSSPHTRTRSGLKSSRILRIARKSLPNRSPQRFAADRPSSLPSSAMSSAGQLAGSLYRASTFGAVNVRLNTLVRPSFGKHKVGQWVTPRPRTSAIFLFLPVDLNPTLILAARLEAKGVLAIHRADGVPIEADMARHGIGVTPRSLHRITEVQAIAARRGVERLDRLHRELGHIGLIAAAADAVGDRDLLAGTKFLGHRPHVGQEDQFGALHRRRGLGVAQLDRRELGHWELAAGERAARLAYPGHFQIGVERASGCADRGRRQHRRAVYQQRHTVE